ncbi:hypothetical protein GCM10011591_02820 [Nocardia camponoti]|uniref:Uncharacterized protein n=1 Tax=Nocardia camponoti TaxID=1616106 RepID=A0A917V4A4_9NOCA|nr:hypothetical protein GCM10011591_02820 [Nocardia camponoti]
MVTGGEREEITRAFGDAASLQIEHRRHPLPGRWTPKPLVFMLSAKQFGTVTTEFDRVNTVRFGEVDQVGRQRERHGMPARDEFAREQDAGLSVASAAGEGEQCTHDQPALTAVVVAVSTGCVVVATE